MIAVRGTRGKRMSDALDREKPIQGKTLRRKVALAHSPIHKHPKIEPSNPSLSQHIQKMSRVREVRIDICCPVCEQKVSVVETRDVGYRRCIVSPWVPGRRPHESFREHRVCMHNVNAGNPPRCAKRVRGRRLNETLSNPSGCTRRNAP